MKVRSIPLTTLTFDLPIIPHMLRKLRGAVIESVMHYKPVFEAAGVPTQVFHNHVEVAQEVILGEPDETPKSEKGQRRLDYPLVQYKVRHQKAEILGIGAGAQAVQLWVSLIGDTLVVNGQEVPLTVRNHVHQQWKPELRETRLYRLNKWLPFSAKNFDLWKRTPRLTDKAAMLDRLVWGHVFHMVEGLGVELDREALELYVSSIDHMTFKTCYGIKKQALDLTFWTNLNLPEEIGLGQGTTIGFGKVQRITKKLK